MDSSRSAVGDAGRVVDYMRQSAQIDVETHGQLLEKYRQHGDLHKLLIENIQLSDDALMELYASALGLSVLGEDEISLHPLNQDISYKFLRDQNVLPLDAMDGHIRLVTSTPCDPYPAQAITLACDKSIELCLAPAPLISRLLEQMGADDASVSELSDELTEDEHFTDGDDVDRLRDLASEAPIVRLVNLLVARALELRASDIHIEPFEKTLRVRYRIDGVLREADSPPAHSAAAVISRIKIMAKLNIAERRLPQDGRIQMRVQAHEIDLRVSTIPSLFGESVVMRILDKEQLNLSFEALGFDSKNIQRLKQLLSRPHGIVLVTGPTGSGKTTTLYTALAALNSPDKKIMTVEDPVEYQLDGIMQMQVKASIGLGFSEALRAIVRQDPDIIMIGEMRDHETASIAIQSALTGHLVFSTLHTNDAGSAVTRLLDIGVDDYLVTSTVIGIIAQRLVRTLCVSCKQMIEPLAGVINEHRLDTYGIEQPVLHQAVGCPDCNGTGYSGRTVILEQMDMNDELRQQILARADGASLQALAIRQGMSSMRQDGIAKVLAGATSLEEVIRVTQET